MKHTYQLVRMVNHISVHSAHEGCIQARAAFVVNHINSFWTSAMKQELVEYAASNQTGFSDISSAAVATLGLTGAK